jgi:hypothetical protein
MWKQRSYREQFEPDEGAGGAGGSDVVDQQDDVAQPDADPAPGGDEHLDNDGAAATDGAQGADAPEGELHIGFDGDEPEEEATNRAPDWLRDLRKADREKAKRIRELEQRLEAATQPQKPQLGPKPTLESCEFDPEKYEAELTAWHERKLAVDQQAAKERQAAEESQKAWNARVAAYNAAKAQLPVSDFDDAEAAVQAEFDTVKQGIILHGAEKPEQLMYALGKSPTKLKELASITDPIKFAFAVARLETKMKTTTRKPATAPEKPLRGSGGSPGAAVDHLERLRAEADRTGDRSKVVEYLRKKSQAQ